MYEDLINRLRETSIWFGELDNVSDLLLEAANTIEELDAKYNKALQDLVKLAKNSPKVANGFGEWIQFTVRPLDEEEKEEHPDWDYILDCKLPDDGEDILVSNGRWVTVDTFFSDDGCYLESNDLEGLWWMPLPEPPKEESR